MRNPKPRFAGEHHRPARLTHRAAHRTHRVTVRKRCSPLYEGIEIRSVENLASESPQPIRPVIVRMNVQNVRLTLKRRLRAQHPEREQPKSNDLKK